MSRADFLRCRGRSAGICVLIGVGAAVGAAFGVGPGVPGASAQEAPAAGPSPVDTLRAAVTRAEAAGDSAALAEAYNGLGAYFLGEGRYAEALDHYYDARAVWTALADSVGLGRVHNNIGAAQYQWGNLGLALESYGRSLAVRRALGDLRGQALVLANIGIVYREWRMFDRGLPAAEESVALAEEAGVASVLAYALHGLGFVRLEMGDMAGAREAFGGSQRVYQDPESGLTEEQVRSGRSLNRHGLARVLLREGDARGAAAILEEVFDGVPLAATARRQAWPLSDLGRAYLALGETGRAVAVLERSLALSQAAGQRPLTTDILDALSGAYEARGDLARALDYERRARVLREERAALAAAEEVAALDFRQEAERRERETLLLRAEQERQQAVIARQRQGFVLGGALLAVSLGLLATLVGHNRREKERGRLLAESNAALEATNQELRDALAEVRTLKGLIPICARCKKVRDDRGFWETVETYVSNRSEALFTHSICNDCGPELYGEFWKPQGEEGAPPAEEEAAPAGPEERG